MIKLENVSDWLYTYKPVACKHGIYYADNVQGLKELYKHDKSATFKGESIAHIIEKTEKEVLKANAKGKQPDIYDVNRHGYENERSRRLLENDKLVDAGVLINNPGMYDYRSYKGFSIDSVKHMLSHTDSSGRNLLGKFRGVGPAKIEQVIHSLRMYDEQVERQYEEYDDSRPRFSDFYIKNIFDNNKEAKQEIVEESLPLIVEYLLDTAESELIWGKLSDTHKAKLLTATRKYNDTRERLVGTLANYTTLTELHSIYETYSPEYVLKRFIKK